MKKYKINNYIIDAESPVKAMQIAKMLDNKIKDSYIYTEVGQDYNEIIKTLKSKGFNVIIMGNASGYGKYIKIEGTKSKLEALQNSGYFEEETIHDSLKDYEPPFAIWVKSNGKWKIWGGSHSQNIDKNAYLKQGYEDVTVVKNGESPKDSVKDDDISYLSKEEEKAIDDYKRAICNTKDPKLLKLFAHILKEETEHLEELETETVEDSDLSEEYKIVNYNNKWYYEIRRKDGFNKLVGPYTSKEETIKWFKKHKPNEIIQDSTKDSYYIVACEKGDFWYDESGNPNSFKNAKKFNSYEEADTWRKQKGSGSVQKITDACKTKDYDNEKLTNDLKVVLSSAKSGKIEEVIRLLESIIYKI